MRDEISLRPLKEALIIAFCLWHMTAIALYNLPDDLPNLEAQVAAGKNFVGPYIRGLSQWQYWAIFSPDPQQNVSNVYTIDRVSSTATWETIQVIRADQFSWIDRMKELKIMDRLENEGWGDLVPFYLNNACIYLGQNEGTQLRLTAYSTVLPRTLDKLKHMATTRLPVTTHILGSTVCPRQ